MSDLSTLRKQFEIPSEVCYLNAAALGPMPRSAIAAGYEGLARKSKPWTIHSHDFFEDTRRVRPKLARLIKADTDGIAFCPSASYGLATVAKNLPIQQNQTIITLADQFPSNIYAWRRVCADTGARLVTVDVPMNTSATTALLEAIGSETALVAIPHVRWTDGCLIDAKAVTKAAHSVGAQIVFDLSQSCGVYPFDVADIKPDYVVCVSYKWLLGPYSLGFIYIAPDKRDGIPLEENWISRRGSNDFTRLIDYTDEYEPGARRFDVGERANFALLPALEASLDLLQTVSQDDIQSYLGMLTSHIVGELEEDGFHTLPLSERSPHYLCVNLPPDAPNDVTHRLETMGVYASQRGDWLRVTPHIYNTHEDCRRLISGLRAILKQGL